jgi:hypothetical protein
LFSQFTFTCCSLLFPSLSNLSKTNIATQNKIKIKSLWSTNCCRLLMRVSIHNYLFNRNNYCFNFRSDFLFVFEHYYSIKMEDEWRFKMRTPSEVWPPCHVSMLAAFAHTVLERLYGISALGCVIQELHNGRQSTTVQYLYFHCIFLSWGPGIPKRSASDSAYCSTLHLPKHSCFSYEVHTNDRINS